MTDLHTAHKKPYHRPQILEWGTVTDLTQTGNSTPCVDPGDAKNGSMPSTGG